MVIGAVVEERPLSISDGNTDIGYLMSIPLSLTQMSTGSSLWLLTQRVWRRRDWTANPFLVNHCMCAMHRSTRRFRTRERSCSRGGRSLHRRLEVHLALFPGPGNEAKVHLALFPGPGNEAKVRLASFPSPGNEAKVRLASFPSPGNEAKVRLVVP